MSCVSYSLTKNASQRGQGPMWQSPHVSQGCWVSSQMYIPLKLQAPPQALPHGTSGFR